MKSKDIKNWRYNLSYDQMADLDDFESLLLEALAEDRCLKCGGDIGFTMTVCALIVGAT